MKILKPSESKKNVPEKELDLTSTDPYGMYGEVDEEIIVDVDVQLSDVEILCKAFYIN